VRVPALNQVFGGKVARFADVLDLETRTLHTEVDVPNPEYVLMPGMYAMPSWCWSGRRGRLSLPVARERVRREATVLVVNANNEIEKRAVTIGMRTPQRVEIKSGVAEGERAVAGNGGGLRAGEKVQPQAAPAVAGGGA